MEIEVEVERKYAVPDEFTLPDLAAAGAVTSVAGPVEHLLDAVYYDTPTMRLFEHRITLRRRSGGRDAGWHLKRPTSDGERSETRLPAEDSPEAVPQALVDQVAPIVGAQPLRPIAEIRTRRREYTLHTADGRPVALVADDLVESRAVASSVARRWREVEVELVGVERELLDAVDAVLRAAGAGPAKAPSKLARALADTG